jgi:heme A synthase
MNDVSPSVWWRAAVGGGLLALAAGGTGALQSRQHAVAASAAALLLGSLGWFMVLKRQPSARLWDGVRVGFLTALLSHLLMWVLLAPFDPKLRSFEDVFVMACLSMIMSYFTLPLGALTGVATVGLARVRAKLMREA